MRSVALRALRPVPQGQPREGTNHSSAVQRALWARVGHAVRRVEPLQELLDELSEAGWTPHLESVDAAEAKSPLARCTNCDRRGSFDYIGIRSESSYRAFWVCTWCGHWTEV